MIVYCSAMAPRRGAIRTPGRGDETRNAGPERHCPQHELALHPEFADGWRSAGPRAKQSLGTMAWRVLRRSVARWGPKVPLSVGVDPGPEMRHSRSSRDIVTDRWRSKRESANRRARTEIFEEEVAVKYNYNRQKFEEFEMEMSGCQRRLMNTNTVSHVKLCTRSKSKRIRLATP